MKLQLHILAQAIEDVLRFELGLPLVGAAAQTHPELYAEALSFLARYPTLVNRWKYANKRAWLKEVHDARL